jgi:hypothetical protein
MYIGKLNTEKKITGTILDKNLFFRKERKLKSCSLAKNPDKMKNRGIWNE